MPETVFTGIKACVFDAYGTLFNIHAPVAQIASAIGDDADAVSNLWRLKQLQYTWLRSLMGSYVEFWQVTGEALDYALAAHGIDNPKLRQQLMDLYFTIDAYPDARSGLAALKAAGFKTAILSNGSAKMLNGAVSSGAMEDLLDELISVDEIGIYKPDARVYQLAVDRMGVAGPEEICFVSANPWDAQAGAHFGFQVARVNRFGLADDNIPGTPKALIDTIDDLAGLLT